MEITILFGFVLANFGIICGHVLTRCLPDERADVEKLFRIKQQFLFVGLAGILAALYPQPITAGVLFVLLLIVGSSVVSWKPGRVVMLWLCSITAFVVPYVIKKFFF